MSSNGLLVVAPSAYPLGGIATWLDGLLPGLTERGWSVRLALPRGRTFEVEAYLRRHPWSPTVLLENPSGTAYGRRRAVTRLLRDATEEIVLVVNQPEVYAAALAERAVRRTVPRVVGTLHGLLPQLVEDFRRCASAMTAAVGTSRLACEALAELAGIERSRVLHAPYGTVVGSAPELEPIRMADPLTIVFAGRLEEEQKRVSLLPRIAAALDALRVDWRLSIAGAGSAERTLRQAFEGDWRVSFLGDLPSERLRRELFQPGRVLLLTSRWETGPIVAWEAMERGLILVTACFFGLRAEGALRDGANCRIFPDGDAAAAAACLAALAAAPAERQRLAISGRRLVEERYSPERCAGTWDKCLRAALDLEPPEKPGSAPGVPPAGRLDRWLGAGAADRARRLLRKPAGLIEPGDEWPHTFGGGLDEKEFFDSLRGLEDAVVAEGGR